LAGLLFARALAWRAACPCYKGGLQAVPLSPSPTSWPFPSARFTDFGFLFSPLQNNFIFLFISRLNSLLFYTYLSYHLRCLQMKLRWMVLIASYYFSWAAVTQYCWNFVSITVQ
jgi:hypothetical protein